MNARQPRALVKVNGTVTPGWIEWSVSNNSYYEADTYSVTFAASKLPQAMNANWFSNLTADTFIEILAGFPANPASPDPADPGFMSFIYGRIDDMDFDPVMQTLALKGRDLTGAFIDTKIADGYANQTSSQIATKLASEHNLTPQITATTTQVGTYYTQDTIQINANRSEWDLLSFLARQEGFVVYVSNQTLYFGPDQTDSSNPYALTYTPSSDTSGSPIANFVDIKLSRTMTVAKGITVTVKSAGLYNATVTKSYPTAPKAITPGKSSPYGSTTNYYYTLPAGMTATQVEKYAEQVYNNIISHAMKLEANLPADNDLSTQRIVKLSGTGTAFDQTYYPKVVTRSMSMSEGYRMRVEAQNTSPNLTPALDETL